MTDHVALTTFSTKGLAEYARFFLASYSAMWADTVPLLVYHEGVVPDGPWTAYDLRQVKDCADFRGKYAGNRRVSGQEPTPGFAWKRNDLKKGYSFRFDAYRFQHKVFAIQDAAQRVGPVKLFWMDADLLLTRKVSSEVLDAWLPDDVDVCYLDRTPYHSECGFVGYNLMRFGGRRLIQELANQYRTGEVFNLREWHDSFVFDEVCDKMRAVLSVHKILHTSNADPVGHSELAKYMKHYKGARKNQMKEEAAI